jgi:hypothetical protein
MIPKGQVSEMERMFSDTISRLSARVIALEKMKDVNGSGAASSGTGNVPEKLSKAHIGADSGFRELPPIPQGPMKSSSLSARPGNPRLVGLGLGAGVGTNLSAFMMKSEDSNDCLKSSRPDERTPSSTASANITRVGNSSVNSKNTLW